MLITSFIMIGVAASLAEICSAVPLSGSIYIWAAEAGGRRFGRFFGFVVALWTTTAWTSFVASLALATTNFMLSELVIFEIDFPGGVTTDNINFRALSWACSVVFLALAIAVNYSPPRVFAWVFRIAFAVIMLDALLTFIWLPIAVSRSYGFQSASFVFTSTYNGTGAPDGWAWLLSYVFTSGILTGFDAAGHVSEEVQGASLRSARGIFWSCVATAAGAFPTLIVFLFCSPDLDTLFALSTPQPFVQLYQLSMGTGGQVFMTIVCIAGLFVNMVVCIVAASRLVFAIARDGVLPGSSWIGKVGPDGVPRNATTFIGGIAFVLLCIVLANVTAFNSLISCGAVPTIAAYGLIALLRIINKTDISRAVWSTGRWSKLLLWVTVPWCAFITATLLSPVEFPVTDASLLNWAPVVLAIVTLIAVGAYLATPESRWLSKRQVEEINAEAAGHPMVGADDVKA